MMSERARYVLAGVGHRGLSFFADPLRKRFDEYGELVGLYDISVARMVGVNRLWGTNIAVYTNFQAMLRELNPDVVMIATNDASHADYVIQTLEARKRAICEKPLAITLDQARRLLETVDRTKSNCAYPSLVTHNMRYEPSVLQIKGMIDTGTIGEVLHITYNENLDRHHGADYFRRWHRFKSNSGGLLIQKGCHHFDVLNWLAGSRPRRVIARGGLHVYGKNGSFRSERCTGCSFKSECNYYANLETWAQASIENTLYATAESESGYFRDGCVFDERINIEDHMNVLYDYENGIEVTYSLTAFSSIESWRIEVEGTSGRIVFEHIYPTDWPPGNYVVPGLDAYESRRFTLYSYHQGVRDIPTDDWEEDWEAECATMLPDLFARPLDAPLTDRQASLEDGVWAVLVGIGANISIETNSRPVALSSLLSRAGLQE
jgi:predicted dehydrogenase